MTLHEKILKLYPDLPNEPWINHGIFLQNDSDGRGDYIARWDHPTLPRPTQEQLNEIS
jgi:hypothetical protein